MGEGLAQGTASLGQLRWRRMETFGLPQRPYTSSWYCRRADLQPTSLDVTEGKGWPMS